MLVLSNFHIPNSSLANSFSGMEAANGQLSMGACVDLIPTLRKLLDSKFEE